MRMVGIRSGFEAYFAISVSSLEFKMFIWLFVLFLSGSDGLPSGAPTIACTSLMPNHGQSPISAQTSKAPYEIHAEVSGQKVIVRVSSPDGEKFAGFILQARSSKDPSKFIDGTFDVGQTFKSIDCFGGKQNTITHVNPNSKDEIMTEWVPKENIEDAVIFRGTVAKEYATFWDKVDSNPVKLANPVPGTSPASDIVLKGLESCFKTEGCLGLPHDCVERKDCKVLLKYSKSSDGINFILQGILDSNHYMALGLSDDAIMGKDSVTECIRDGTNVIARESWNEGKSNTRTKELLKQRYVGSFVNGVTTCSWKLPLVHVANEETFDFVNNEYHLLIASGPVSEGRLNYHSDKRIPSREALNLTEFNAAAEDTETDDDSHFSEPQPPQTTPYKVDSTSKEEAGSTDNADGTNSSSYLKSTCIIILLTGFLFATKESLKMTML